MTWEFDKKTQDAFVVGKIENNEASRREYVKAINKILLGDNDNLDDNIIGVDCIGAPQDPKERQKLEILFDKLRKERGSTLPYLSKKYVCYESARGIDWNE